MSINIINIKDLIKIVLKGTSELSPRTRKVLFLRFGINEDKGRTLEEVGREFGVTRERIRQIENKALDRIYEMYEAWCELRGNKSYYKNLKFCKNCGHVIVIRKTNREYCSKEENIRCFNEREYYKKSKGEKDEVDKKT